MNLPYLIVAASALSVLIGLLVCLFSGYTNKGDDFDYAHLVQPEAVAVESA
jgi:hypothetical protein